MQGICCPATRANLSLFCWNSLFYHVQCYSCNYFCKKKNIFLQYSRTTHPFTKGLYQIRWGWSNRRCNWAAPFLTPPLIVTKLFVTGWLSSTILSKLINPFWTYFSAGLTTKHVITWHTLYTMTLFRQRPHILLNTRIWHCATFSQYMRVSDLNYATVNDDRI